MTTPEVTPERTVYNPAQQDVIDQLGRAAAPAIIFEPGIRERLRIRLESALGPLTDHLGDTDLYLAKHQLSRVHGCEALYLAEQDDDFSWSVATARGTIAHKAIELSISWRGEPTPIDLVSEAIARLEESDRYIGDFLQTIGDAERAELSGQANEYVSKFLECFPPLRKDWRPVTESAVRVDLFDGRIVLRGRVDLTLGRPRGTRSDKVLIDLKTGGFSPVHVDDLRFYALVETVRIGTPPRMVATYYLDSARLHTEVVTEPLLEAATERVIAAAYRIVELRESPKDAVRRAGPPCRWCPLSPDCEAGQRYLDPDADPDDR